MQTEIEVKFLNIDIATVRQKLKTLEAVCEQPMRLMRRKLFDYPDMRFQKHNHSQRLRVRDEGNKVAINYKSNNETNYAHELEVEVGSFADMCQLLEAIGLETYSYQESKRETWQYKNVEVVIDEWPWLEPYIEIEGESEQAIKKVAEDLGFDWSTAKFGSTDTAYKAQYPGMKEADSIGDVPEVRFDDPVPQFLLDRK